LNYFVSDYFGLVLYCSYLVSWGIVAIDVRLFKLGKGASLLLGSVFGWVAWVNFCFWIIYVLVQGLEIFEFGAMAIWGYGYLGLWLSYIRSCVMELKLLIF